VFERKRFSLLRNIRKIDGTFKSVRAIQSEFEGLKFDCTWVSDKSIIEEDEEEYYGVKRHFQQYFSYIVAVSFIGGGSRIKPPTFRKSLSDKLYHIMLYQVHLAWAGFELTTSVVIGIDCKGSCKSNYIWLRPRQPPLGQVNM